MLTLSKYQSENDEGTAKSCADMKLSDEKLIIS